VNSELRYAIVGLGDAIVGAWWVQKTGRSRVSACEEIGRGNTALPQSSMKVSDFVRDLNERVVFYGSAFPRPLNDRVQQGTELTEVVLQYQKGV
jgi:hypothetical protein